MKVTLGYDDYDLFLKIKALPQYNFCGRESEFPDDYADRLGIFPANAILRQNYKPIDCAFDYQGDITSIAIEREKFAIFADPGLGKGLLPETPILTPSGWKPIGELVVGEMVIGKDGHSHAVTGVFHRGSQPTYKFTFSDNTSLICDSDHFWNVKSKNDKKRGKDWRTLSTKELLETRLIYEGQGIRSRVWEIPLVDPVQFPCGNFLISPYLMGVLLGDGSISAGQTGWHKDDQEIAYRVSSELPFGVSLTTRKDPDKTRYWSIVGDLGKNSIAQEIDNFGLRGTVSDTKFVPKKYLFSSVSERIALLQGLMDTDGYGSETPEFSSSSEQLARDVVFLVQSLGGIANINCKKEPTYEYKGKKLIGKPSWRVTIVLPEGIDPFYLKRKADRYKASTRGLGRWIDSIEYVGDAKTVCIKIDSSDSLFVTSDCIVTHNTLMQFEYVRHVASMIPEGRCILLIAPPMVVPQTIAESAMFYGENLPIRSVRANQLDEWLISGKEKIGITNYEALKSSTPQGRLASLVLDESSILKSHAGKYGGECIRLGKGLRWKLAMTGTPAPNDRVEFANHAVFLDVFPNVNSFLAKFFVNRGQTSNRWEVKPHAIEGFYRSLSHWSIFLTNPATYGWKDNVGGFPPINVHIHNVEMTSEQDAVAYANHQFAAFGVPLGEIAMGGIAHRSVMSQVAKGNHRGKKISTLKPKFIRSLYDRDPEKSTIVWCLYNEEQKTIREQFPDAANINGKTSLADRITLIDDFKSGRRKVLICKPRMLGMGMNLQIARRHIFSGLQDSYEAYFQCIKRSNRIGSSEPLEVDIPITPIERPMIETVLRKAARVQEDTATQERIFRDASGWRKIAV